MSVKSPKSLKSAGFFGGSGMLSEDNRSGSSTVSSIPKVPFRGE